VGEDDGRVVGGEKKGALGCKRYGQEWIQSKGNFESRGGGKEHGFHTRKNMGEAAPKSRSYWRTILRQREISRLPHDIPFANTTPFKGKSSPSVIPLASAFLNSSRGREQSS